MTKHKNSPSTIALPENGINSGPEQHCSPAVERAVLRRFHAGVPSATTESDVLARESAIALEYNGISHATLLATPLDLEELALGFSLTEGIVRSAADIRDIDVTPTEQGHIVQLSIAGACFAQLKQRRRTLAGRTGCGLCGLESLDDVVRPLPPVAGPKHPIAAAAIMQAMDQLRGLQPIHQQTGATHAAAWSDLSGKIQHVREDVGRHNALDKLIGTLLHRRLATDTSDGFVLISSRASFEMVQKSAAVGISAVVAVSAPTHYAVQTARELGVLLAGFARGHDFNVYCHEAYMA